MQKHPSNAIFYVIISIFLLLGIYIGGTLILQARQEVAPEGALEEDEGFDDTIQLELQRLPLG
jgi:hypothetical protein